MSPTATGSAAAGAARKTSGDKKSTHTDGLHFPPVYVPTVHLSAVHLPTVPAPHVPVPHVAMPTGMAGRVLWWGGLATAAAFGVVDWPVAVLVGAGSWVAEQYAKTAQHPAGERKAGK
jgi:hypothetical protein